MCPSSVARKATGKVEMLIVHINVSFIHLLFQ